MRGSHLFGWRYLRRRKLRYALTALGIVLGVANVFGVFVANATTNRSLQEGARSFFGTSDAIVFAQTDEPSERDEVDRPPPTFSDETLAVLGRINGVEAVAPRSAIYAALGSKDGHLEPLPRRTEDADPDPRDVAVYLGGFDVVGARRERVLEEGRVYRPGAPEAIASREATRRLGKGIGDVLEVRARRAPDGPRGPKAPLRLEIVGVYTPTWEGGSEALADRSVVNRAWEMDGSSAAFVYLEPGVEPDLWAVTHEDELPELRFVASRLPSEFREFLDVIQNSLTGTATVALFVGAFLIYLTFTMSVVERTRLYGTLHAVGATEGQVRRAVLTEALSLGAVATVAGMVAGLGLAALLVRIMTRLAETAPARLTITPGAAATGLAVGLLATFAGALTPALRAGRISPVDAIRGSLTSKPRPTRIWVLGLVLALGGALFHLVALNRPRPQLGTFTGLPTLLLLLGSVLLVPAVVPPLARACRLIARRLSPGLGDVAVMHLVRERTRSAYTLGLVMVVLAMILTLGAARASLGGVVDRWVETRFGADLLVYGDDFPDEAAERLAEVDGIRSVTTATFDRVRVTRPAAGRVHNLIVIDPSSFFDVAGFPWADGDDASARAALERGGAVLLPATTATRLGVERGGSVTLRTRQGPRDFTLAGTYASIAAGNEVGFVAGIRDGRELFGADEPNVLYIGYAEGADPRATARGVERSLGVPDAERSQRWRLEGDSGGYSLGSYFFITGTAIKAQARGVLNSYMSLFLAVLLIGMLVGLLGLANTLATSVLHRYREIGALQAIGAAPKDVRRMILVESGTLVAAALVLSVVLGVALGRVVLGGSNELLGFSPGYVFPWRWVPGLAALAVVVSLAAAVAPARRAARLTPIEALRYE